MRLTRLVLVLLICLAFTFSLVGCNSGRGEYDADNFLPNGTEDNPYQIVAEKTTIIIFVPRGSMNPSYSSMKMFQVLSKMTNLEFEFREADTSAYTSLRTAAWANTDDLPDLFLFANTVSEQVQYSEAGALAAFNDDNLTCSWGVAGNLIENYMPNYKALLESNFGIDTETSASEVATLSDGYMYSTISANDVPRDLTYKMFINREWINNCNNYYDANLPDADEIDTVEEYLAVLRAFKKYDANRNGKTDDEIPVTAASLKYLRNFILQSYGYVSNDVEITSDGTKFVYVPNTEAYKKYLETMRVMYQEGLLDNNTFSMTTDAMMAQKGNDGILGSFCSAAAYLTVGNDYESQYVTFGPMTSAYYTGTPIQYGFSNFLATGAVIPSSTPYVREVARLLDIMYSEVGCQLIAYGEEGVDFTWEDEEKTSFVFNVPDSWNGSQEEYRATITPNVGTGSALFWSYDFVGKMNDSVIKALNEMSEIYTPYLKVPVPEEIKLSYDGYQKTEQIRVSLSAFLESYEYEMITSGDNKIESGWAEFQSKLKGYKCEEYLKYYNDALAEYKKA